eukprot:gene2969-1951_t
MQIKPTLTLKNPAIRPYCGKPKHSHNSQNSGKPPKPRSLSRSDILKPANIAKKYPQNNTIQRPHTRISSTICDNTPDLRPGRYQKEYH